MAKTVRFATGNLYVPGREKIDDSVRMCSKLDIDGVELTLLGLSDVNGLKLGKANIRFLRSLKLNTIHAPLFSNRGRIAYKNDMKSRKIISRLHKIYDLIGATNINFHPTSIRDFRILKENDYDYSIENMPRRYGLPHSYYRRILSDHPHLMMVLDASHALEFSPEELKRMVKDFRRDIIYTHLSVNIGRGIHLPLHMVSESVRRTAEPARKLNDFVIETWLEKLDMDIFKKEVSFVRKWIRR